MSQPKPGLFTAENGKKLGFTFALVSTLFLLWGFCNGMIDVMDKHFQEQLGLTKAQSAWVQFAHYMGYALMALPAGLLTRKIGYKGGIIFGLLLVAAGGFWFLPATSISAFWAFLLGVCLIAMGLTVLETVANPYTTVLGPKEFAATRINLAQSMNGVGWILGPLIGGAYFYAEGGAQVAHGQLYVPYVGVGIVVLVLAAFFFFANVPDVQTEDEFHTDDEIPVSNSDTNRRRGTIFLMMLLNVFFVGLSLYLVLHTILPFIGISETTVNHLLAPAICLGVLAIAPFLFRSSRTITTHSIWAHPHFSAATISQFVYVAAQAGIFAFFINTMTVDKAGFSLVPAIPASLAEVGWLAKNFVSDASGIYHLSDRGGSNLASMAFGFFLFGRLVGAWLTKKFPANSVLAIFGLGNIAACALIMLNLGWLSVIAVFLTYLFMSIMYPTIFALGIHGFGTQARKKAAAFIVMSITGGALLPKLMGYLGDTYNMSVAFIMPLVCFAGISLYAFLWPALRGSAAGSAGGSTGSGR